MAFVEVQFPTDISYGSVGGPEYSTDVIITQGGYEKRNMNWSQARARYNVAHGVKSQSQLDTLVAFFRARKGKATGFRFKDWTDYQVTGQVLGTGDNSTTEFQLIRTYQSGAGAETRTITKPVAGTVDIFLDSVVQSSGVTVDTTTGVVTFDSAPGTDVVIAADFEFDVPVRFDTDRLGASLDAFGSHSWLNIPLVEVRV